MSDSPKPHSAAYRAAVAAVEDLYADPAELGAFMTARLDEDFSMAEDARNDLDGVWEERNRSDGTLKGVDSLDYSITEGADIDSAPYFANPHIARHDPMRVLAEVAAKREHLRMWLEERATLKDVYANPGKYLHDQKIALVGAVAVMECVVRMDAAIYDRHPDFKPEWRLP